MLWRMVMTFLEYNIIYMNGCSMSKINSAFINSFIQTYQHEEGWQLDQSR